MSMANTNPKNYIRIANGHVDARLDVLFYSENGIYYAFAPAIDLVGYGLTQEEARASFGTVFQEYIKFGVENKTLDRDLQRHGWQSQGRRFASPGFVVVLQNNKQLQKVVTTRDYAKASENFAYEFCR